MPLNFPTTGLCVVKTDVLNASGLADANTGLRETRKERIRSYTTSKSIRNHICAIIEEGFHDKRRMKGSGRGRFCGPLLHLSTPPVRLLSLVADGREENTSPGIIVANNVSVTSTEVVVNAVGAQPDSLFIGRQTRSKKRKTS